MLGLKSTVIAKRVFEQLPTSNYHNRRKIHYVLPLTSAAKSALKHVPKTVKSIKYGLNVHVTGPPGVKVIADKWPPNRPGRFFFKLLV